MTTGRPRSMNRNATAKGGSMDLQLNGKTALVKALTGVDTDRLAEEKRRGITIDLGYAYTDEFGFVDVPPRSGNRSAQFRHRGSVRCARSQNSSSSGHSDSSRACNPSARALRN